ncbi:holo-[acyl-carrier-protein] synthase [Desulfurobacterium pacificum]|uniref:Holo-[acyl-carrier-protein] synthase n=1 Tax=Desulfurobacterium pacificum TaxID=240166 RepID=A0ABY1NDX5_9BACT|nr:4'-phosphopantetheinyl transferase superfamily protein [Desulfurobacterium pacificum]SMP07220.1 holo-[acyl-carrier-protein] synthase [Desulfurobacterium pacificum]
MTPVGVGVDIVSVKRVKSLLEKYGRAFVKKVLPEDDGYCGRKRKGELAGCYAARFALKEAFVKAFSQADVKVKITDVKVSGGGESLKVETPYDNVFHYLFSISHEKEYAVAFVVLFKRL